MYFFFFVWVYLKQKVYFNRPNNLEDLLQRIRSKMERKALTLLSAVYKVSVSAESLAGINFNICVKLYCFKRFQTFKGLVFFDTREPLQRSFHSCQKNPIYT
jgi:hypothetical protein